MRHIKMFTHSLKLYTGVKPTARADEGGGVGLSVRWTVLVLQVPTAACSGAVFVTAHSCWKSNLRSMQLSCFALARSPPL